MNLVDQHFKDALRELPEKKMSWLKSRRTRQMLVQRARELDGRTPIWLFLQRLVAVPMALMVLLTATAGYGYASPSVVKGDLLYPFKTSFEGYLYPTQGTSEERVAFHLWLSERRYAEVGEILQRLGKAPVAFVPAAYAQESGVNPLDALLLETLQSATQHVDYALLISGEIRDVERVKAVREQIQSTVVQQQAFVKKAAPALKSVKLQQKKKSRIKKAVPAPAVDAFSLSIPAPLSVEAVPVPESISEQPPLASMNLAQPMALEAPVLVDESIDVEDVESLVEDTLSFQIALLETIEQKVTEASSAGQADVELDVHLEFAEVPEVEEASDELFRAALTTHYEETQKVLTAELEEIDQVLLQEVSAPVVDAGTVPAPQPEVLPEVEVPAGVSIPEAGVVPSEVPVVLPEEAVVTSENAVEELEAPAPTSLEAVPAESPQGDQLPEKDFERVDEERDDGDHVEEEDKDQDSEEDDDRDRDRSDEGRRETGDADRNDQERKSRHFKLLQESEEKRQELKEVERRIEKLRREDEGRFEGIRENSGARIFDDRRDGRDRERQDRD